jgi:hypothetical protein
MPREGQKRKKEAGRKRAKFKLIETSDAVTAINNAYTFFMHTAHSEKKESGKQKALRASTKLFLYLRFK